jgi:hypothetical protein
MRATVRSSSSRISASSSTTSTRAPGRRADDVPPCLSTPDGPPQKTKICTRPRPQQFELGAIRVAQLAGNVETETRTMMVCGEEGLEDLFPPIVSHTLAIVNHMQFHLTVGLAHHATSRRTLPARIDREWRSALLNRFHNT